MSEYVDVSGIVQFDVATKDVNGKTIREAVINSLTNGSQIRCTIWDSYPADKVPLKKGDFLVVSGKATQNKATKADGTETVYNNLSVTKLIVVEGIEPTETDRVVNPKAAPADVNDVF